MARIESDDFFQLPSGGIEEIPQIMGGPRCVCFHWTFENTNFGMTCGGLYEAPESAQRYFDDQVKLQTVRGTKPPIDHIEIIELQVGEEFNPMYVGGKTYIHGENDGTHNSQIEEPYHELILRDQTIPAATEGKEHP